MAGYDNTRYTYAQVLAGNGYYAQDTQLRKSSGVEEMQGKLNRVGFWCGAVDGKFGAGTDEAVRHFQEAYGLDIDGLAGRGTLTQLDSVAASNVLSFTKTSGTYGVYFDNRNKKFHHNQQVVYETLKNAGLANNIIAAIMGNIDAESGFSTAWEGHGSSAGICQWNSDRNPKLETYGASIGKPRTSIYVQADMIVLEGTEDGDYSDVPGVKCFKDFEKTGNGYSVSDAADHFMARFERCLSFGTWEEAANSSYGPSRFSTVKNVHNGRYYIDTPKRRGYAETYATCIARM